MKYTLEKFLTESKVRISKVCLTINNLIQNKDLESDDTKSEIKFLVEVLNGELKLLCGKHNYKEIMEYQDFLQQRHFKDSNVIMMSYPTFYISSKYLKN